MDFDISVENRVAAIECVWALPKSVLLTFSTRGSQRDSFTPHFFTPHFFLEHVNQVVNGNVSNNRNFRLSPRDPR